MKNTVKALIDENSELRERVEELERQMEEKEAEIAATQEALQEAHRCLRCDHFGYGAFKGGRVKQW